MLDAICTHTDANRTFSVLGFQKLSDSNIEKYRQYLECPECRGKAYYRKESVDGKAACFGSRYHSDDCYEGRSSPQREREVCHAVEVNQILSKSDELYFDFNITKPTSAQLSVTKRPSKQTDTGTKEAKSYSKSTNLMRSHVIGMEKALNSLMRGSDLAASEALIEIDEGYKFKAKNLFVNFADAEAADSPKEAKPKMYWGTISHSDIDLDWLNPSDCNDVGIPIQKHKSKILSRYEIKEKRDIEGAGIIMFGKCFWNSQKNRKIIELWNSDRIFISRIDE